MTKLMMLPLVASLLFGSGSAVVLSATETATGGQKALSVAQLTEDPGDGTEVPNEEPQKPEQEQGEKPQENTNDRCIRKGGTEDECRKHTWKERCLRDNNDDESKCQKPEENSQERCLRKGGTAEECDKPTWEERCIHDFGSLEACREQVEKRKQELDVERREQGKNTEQGTKPQQ